MRRATQDAFHARPEALLLSAGIGIGGSEQVVVNLTHGMVQAGFPVRAVFPGSLDATAKAWLDAAHLPIETDPAVLRINEPRNGATIRRLVDFLRQSSAPVVNLHYGGNFVFLKDIYAVRMAGKQAIASVHHPYTWSEMGQKKRLQTFLCRPFLKRVIVPTVLMRGIMEQAGIPRHKLTVIPYGIAEPAIRPPRAQARDRFCLPRNGFVVSTLARLTMEKGIGDLIEAMGLLAVPDAVLIVAGDGPARAELEAQVQRYPQLDVRFLGRVDRTEEVYAASDLFVLPSYMEGFGLVYIEAAMQGVPSIGSRVGGVPEAIEAGVTGILTPPRAPNDLAEAIRSLYSDRTLCAQMGNAARKRAFQHFTSRAMGEAYARVLFD